MTYLKQHGITDEALERIRTDTPPLRTLEMPVEFLKTSQVEALCAAMREGGALKTLACSLSTTNSDGIKTFVEFLKTDTTLEELDLSGTNLDDWGSLIAEVLQENTTLKRLRLGATQITDRGAKNIADALEENTTLEAIAIGSNKLGRLGAGALVRALGTNTTLQEFELHSSNGANRDVGMALAEVLTHNRTLRSLKLKGCLFGVEAMQAIAEVLKTNTSVEHLNMDGCAGSVVGVQAMADMLKNNSTLKVLDISGNGAGQGAIDLAEALTKNTGLRELYFWAVDLSETEQLAMAEALGKNDTLVKISVGGKRDPAPPGFTEALERNTGLIYFSTPMQPNFDDLMEANAETARGYVRLLDKRLPFHPEEMSDALERLSVIDMFLQGRVESTPATTLSALTYLAEQAEKLRMDYRPSMFRALGVKRTNEILCERGQTLLGEDFIDKTGKPTALMECLLEGGRAQELLVGDAVQWQSQSQMYQCLRRLPESWRKDGAIPGLHVLSAILQRRRTAVVESNNL